MLVAWVCSLLAAVAGCAQGCCGYTQEGNTTRICGTATVICGIMMTVSTVIAVAVFASSRSDLEDALPSMLEVNFTWGFYMGIVIIFFTCIAAAVSAVGLKIAKPQADAVSKGGDGKPVKGRDDEVETIEV